jgi:transposase-like protein
MKDNNKTTIVTTTSKVPALLKPLDVSVNPEFKEAATKAAQQTKDTTVLVAQKIGALGKLLGRKVQAAAQAAKETH